MIRVFGKGFVQMFVRSNIDDSFIVIVTFLCISLIAEKVRSSSDFEPTQQGGHVYPMAVVLYDETLLTPFQKDSRQFTFDGIDVSIKQNWKEVGVAAVVWDAVRFVFHIFGEKYISSWS